MPASAVIAPSGFKRIGGNMLRAVTASVAVVLATIAPRLAVAQEQGWIADFDWQSYGLARFGIGDAVTGKVILSSTGDLPGPNPAPWGHPLRSGWRLKLIPNMYDPVIAPFGTKLTWDVAEVGSFTSTFSSGSDGSIDILFPRLGTFSVTLTGLLPDGTKSSKAVLVKVRDFLIVAIGDSYSSGEGNPQYPNDPGTLLLFPDPPSPFYYSGDVIADPGVANGGAALFDYWAYKGRCHQSVISGPSIAAREIAAKDPRDSVTFVHLACSGATITDGLIGQQYAFATQLEQLLAIGGSRRIDALLVSIGGNDIGFKDILLECGWKDLMFASQGLVWVGCNTTFPSWMLYESAAMRLPGKLDTLQSYLKALNLYISPLYTKIADGGGTVLSPSRVYHIEYADPTTYISPIAKWAGGGRKYCGEFPAWWIPIPNLTPWLPAMFPWKSRWASRRVVGGLNRLISQNAVMNGWSYVGEIASSFHRGGHGFCGLGSDCWMISPEESLGRQSDVYGSMHPNEQGVEDIGRVLTDRLLPDLLNPPPEPVLFLTASSAVVGHENWYVGACDATGACTSDGVSVALLATSAVGFDPAQPLLISVDGQHVLASVGVCSTGIANVGCDYVETLEHGVIASASWTIRFMADGVHTVAGTVLEVGSVPRTNVFEVKVDLHDPAMTGWIAQDQSGLVPGDAGWYRSPVTVSFLPQDPPNGSGVDYVELFDDAQETMPSEVGDGEGYLTIVNADGIHPLSFRAFDVAGRMSPIGTMVLKVDQTPPTLDGAPDRASSARGWYNADVVVVFPASDATSGIAQSTAPVTLDVGARQYVQGYARDVAGNGSHLTVGPISIDETMPVLSVVSASDGVFTMPGGQLAEVAFLTNSSSLEMTFLAYDVLSGLWSVLFDGTTAFYSRTVSFPLVPGVSIHALSAEDVAGNVSVQGMSAVYAPLSSPPVRARPANPGFWRDAVVDGFVREDDMADLLSRVNEVSGLFAGPTNRYPALTLQNYRAFLNVSASLSYGDFVAPLPTPATPGSGGYEALDRHVRAELLTAWLNLVAGYAPTSTVVTSGPPRARGSALEALWRVEEEIAASGEPNDLASVLGSVHSIVVAVAP